MCDSVISMGITDDTKHFYQWIIQAAQGGISGVYIYRILKISDFWYICEKKLVLRCFFRIRAVQKVIRDPAQLSGRGFSRIFYMKLFLSQLYIFWTHLLCPNCQMLTHIFSKFRNFKMSKFRNSENSWVNIWQFGHEMWVQNLYNCDKNNLI